MGYHIFSYGLDVNKVHAAIASADEHLFNEITESETFDLYESQDIHGEVTTREALRQLIFGLPRSSRSAHAYWYAFISVCAHLGQTMASTHEIKLGYETDLINQYLRTIFGINLVIEEVLINESVPFDLPRVQDWPLSGLLNRADLTRLSQLFMQIEITDEQLEELLEEDDEKEMAYDSIRQLKRNFHFCLANNLDLISFCH